MDKNLKCPNKNCNSKNVSESGYDYNNQKSWWICGECGEIFPVNENVKQ